MKTTDMRHNLVRHQYKKDAVAQLLLDFIKRRSVWLVVATMLTVMFGARTEENLVGTFAVFIGLFFLLLESRGDLIYTCRTLPVSRAQFGFARWLQSVAFFPLLAALSYQVIGQGSLTFDSRVLYFAVLNMGAAAFIVISVIQLARVIAIAWPNAFMATGGIAGAGALFMVLIVNVAVPLVTAPAYLHTPKQMFLMTLAFAAILLSLSMLRSLGSLNVGRHVRIAQISIPTVSAPRTFYQRHFERVETRFKKFSTSINPLAGLHVMIQELIDGALTSTWITLVVLCIQFFFNWVSEHPETTIRSSNSMYSVAMPSLFLLGSLVERYGIRQSRMLPIHWSTLCAWYFALQLVYTLPCIAGLALSNYIFGGDIAVLRTVTFAAFLIAFAPWYQIVGLVLTDKNARSVLFVLFAMPLILLAFDNEALPAFWLSLKAALTLLCFSAVLQVFAFYHLIACSSWVYRRTSRIESRASKEL